MTLCDINITGDEKGNPQSVRKHWLIAHPIRGVNLKGKTVTVNTLEEKMNNSNTS